MRAWIKKNRFLVLLLGAAVLMGYTHQIKGQILSHHHCVAHSGPDHHGAPHDHHHDHCPGAPGDVPPAGSDSSCHCDGCHLTSVMVDLPALFTTLTAINPLAVEANEPVPESPVPALDLPPIISAA